MTKEFLPSLRTITKRIHEIPIEVLMNELNLIKEKRSLLLRRQRDLVILRMAYLESHGMVTNRTEAETPVQTEPV